MLAYRLAMQELLEQRYVVEVEAEKNGTATRKDFFHYLLNARDKETGARIERSEFVGEAALLVGAGSDTSSTAMAACFFYLLHNPSALRTLQEEVRGAFAEVEDIRSGSKLASLSWLRACIDEAMRMTPPVPGALNRRVMSGGAVVDGCHLPAGTVVGVPIYAIHHNENYFTGSFSFRPERWIERKADYTAEDVAKARSAFCPFSIGSRQCIGKNLAYMELLLTVARVVWLFDIRLLTAGHTGGGDPGSKEKGRQRLHEFQTQDWLVSSKSGPWVQFKRRRS